MKTEIKLDNGKYTYIFDNGKQYALRYGEEWRDLTGDKLIYCLGAEIEKLRAVCAEAYQLAGFYDAPVKALDNLSAAASGEELPHESFLPIVG